MKNQDIEAAWNYHNSTKHSYRSVRNNPHYMDWDNQPSPFKIYRHLDPIPLSHDLPQSGVAAVQVVAAEPVNSDQEAVPDLRSLASILYYSAGITKRRKFPGGETYFRAAACTGALYEIDLHLVCRDLPDLPAGIYHFNPGDFALRKMRTGDYRRVLVDAAAEEDATAQAPVIIVCTGTYWRNAWKYQARTYRHFGWDNGTILANLLAISAAFQLPARVVTGFVDAQVNELLALDTQREVALHLVPIGKCGQAAPPAPDLAPLRLETVPLSRSEVDYPLMREMHEASSLESAEEVARWRGRAPAVQFPVATGQLVALDPYSLGEAPQDVLEAVISRRGSTRQFAREGIGFRQLSTILDAATGGIIADFLEPYGSRLNDLYVIVHAVEGLSPGSYVLQRDASALELLLAGDFREAAGYLGLEQELPADAAVAVFFLADLKAILARYGNRGYRAVQLEAGILGGKMYLLAYAQRLGATGLTFYDDEVTRFFSPHAEGKSAIFLVALGRRFKNQV